MIYPKNHAPIRGENSCKTPQTTCPRLPGEGYDKCTHICNQPGHAEVQAINAARALGVDLKGATAKVFGIDWICKNCGNALHAAGINDIHLNNEVLK
jgi:deoxycytidylate deaminase